ncbi:MAG: amidohydrolase family protein [Ilumatobacteraceae bacterium]
MTVTLWTNATVATMRGGSDEYGLIEGGAVAWGGETILAVGSCNEVRTMIDADAELEEVDLDEIDLEGRLVTPGLVDCHTHLVFAGSRAAEFERRIAGVTYAEIAAAGGGIRTTMTATAQRPRTNSSPPHCRDSTPSSVTVSPRWRSSPATASTSTPSCDCSAPPIASPPNDTSRSSRRCSPRTPCHPSSLGVRTTIAFVCDTIIPAVAASGLAGAVDVFCESIAFDLDQSRRVAQAAAEHGLSIKGHTEQLSALGGGPMLAAAGALSIDHGEHLGDHDVDVIAEHGTVVVLLPGACYFTGERQRPPVEAMRAAGVPMAVATDTNPGTSPLASLRLAANQACVMFGLTVPEAMHGVTSVAARALGLHDRGRITTGARADLVAWDVDHPAELVYEPVTPRQYRRIVAGSA